MNTPCLRKPEAMSTQALAVHVHGNAVLMLWKNQAKEFDISVKSQINFKISENAHDNI